MKEIISYGRFRCKELAPHKNRGMEITYIEKGTLEWMVEGVSEKIAPGSIFFTLPWQVHGSLQPKEPDNTIWHVLFHLETDYPRPQKQFQFQPCFGFSPSEMKILSTAICAGKKHCYRATPAMRWIMPTLIRELQSTHELSHAHSISLLRAVLVELKRIVTGDAVDIETHTWSENKVQSLLNELSANCDQPWTLEQMATRCGIQRTRLNIIFQKLTSSTPMEYLLRLRMQRAKTLLRETEIKIIDIAFECGFSSSQYFANTFKNATGMTPTGYRMHCTVLKPDDLFTLKDMDFRSEQEERKRVQTFSSN